MTSTARIALLVVVLTGVGAAGEPQFIGARPGATSAVVVDSSVLIHSEQVWGESASVANNKLRELLESLPKSANSIVKLNVCGVDQAAIDDMQKLLRDQFPHSSPATSFVVGALENSQARVALDAIVAVHGIEESALPRTSRLRSLKPGPRVYISGQAEKGATPAEATRNTLASLRRTLEWLGCSMQDVVQAKSFLSPMSSIQEVKQEFARAFGPADVPPMVFVEWGSAGSIEIELIAAAPKPVQANAPRLEFLTPPEMKASPVYCRVVKVNAPETIYIGGLYSAQAGSGAVEVTDVFSQLGTLLREVGSDMRHLVKATYYVSSNDTSSKLNELRPNYYDPLRPPAASKAAVPGTGMAERAFTADWIAVRSN